MHTSNDTTTSLDRLDIDLLDDGCVELKQGTFEYYDISVTLHRCHLDLLARMTGYVPADEVGRACERVQDRLRLLASMVEAHTQHGAPLRAAVAAIVPEHVPVSAMPRTPPATPESAPVMTAASTMAAPPDLFSEKSDGEQKR